MSKNIIILTDSFIHRVHLVMVLFIVILMRILTDLIVLAILQVTLLAPILANRHLGVFPLLIPIHLLIAESVMLFLTESVFADGRHLIYFCFLATHVALFAEAVRR